jgi:uroporphyrinogen-III decarboxylase
MIADFLRGTHGIMLDMYKQPDKLLEAINRFTPMTIELGLSNVKTDICPVIFIPLHKGADTWMSNEQFKKFYWPCLIKLMMGLYEEGLVPFPLAEATYNNRLEIIADVPNASTMWWFEQVDMKRAKEIVGKNTSIAGGIPASLLSTGSKQEVKDSVKQLIEDCGKGGGYMMSVTSSLEQAIPENVHALMEALKEYGMY